MDMNNNFKVKSIWLRANWFDEDGKVFKIGYDAFLMYLTLYRFCVRYEGVESKNRYEEFRTSISELKKMTGFTMIETYKLIKILIRHKMIKTSVTNWGQYTDKELIIIVAIDLPHIISGEEYIHLDTSLVQAYLDRKFKGREIAYHCLVKVHSNNDEGNCYLTIGKTAKLMRIGIDTTNKMIRGLNREYLLSSYYRNIKLISKTGFKLEQYMLNNLSDWETFKKKHMNNIEKNIKLWDKENEPKRKLRAKNKITSVTDKGVTSKVVSINSVKYTPTPQTKEDQEELLPF